MSNDRPPTRRARQQQRRRRRERIAGAVVVVLGIAVAVVAVIALQRPGGPNRADSSQTTTATISKAPGSSTSAGRSSSASATTPARSSSSATATATARKLPLIVLNNTTTSGLAHDAADTFNAGGWPITRYDNLSGDITDVVSTCAYYDPSVDGAQASAEALQAQFPAITRVRERFSDLPEGPIVVVLTSDYSG